MTKLILSLYPGADLFGRAFDEQGYCVVRGPERFLGQDIRDFHAVPDCFGGVIGGPPCQMFSAARRGQGDPWNGIPDFMRVVGEANPDWWVMENVRGVLKDDTMRKSEGFPIVIRDWDCGGLTKRIRVFYFWPLGLAMFAKRRVPAKRPRWKEDAVYTVTASCGAIKQKSGQSLLKAKEAARLQGYPDLYQFPHRSQHYLSNEVAVWLLGNGVPRAMGQWVAQTVRAWEEST